MRRAWFASVLAAAALIAVPSGASASTTVGQTFTPNNLCVSDTTFLQSVSPGSQYAAPTDGVITSWSFQADAAPPQLKFKVARPLGGEMFNVVGESGPVTPTASAVNTYPIRIPVRAGDVIGFYTVTVGGCISAAPPGYQYSFINEDVPPGATRTFTLNASDRQLDLSARLEPDCDRDGFGDETQDSQFSGAPPCPEVRCGGALATIVGTNGPNVITGTPGRDVIAGLGGDDNLSGLDGDDVVCAGDGNDTVTGGRGKDNLNGQSGNDKVNGGSAKDKLKGKGGDDTLKGGPAKDTLKGGPGKDKLFGQGAADKLSGQGGTDTCIGGPGDDGPKSCEKQKSI